MDNINEKRIAEMTWDELETRLQPSARGRKGLSPMEKQLREYFGPEEYEYLQKLSAHASFSRKRSQVRGTIILLNGIMGADLNVIQKNGDEDLVWIHLLRLAGGQVSRLKMTPDGSNQVSGDIVKAIALHKRAYARAILWLRARWNVRPFPFDWRRDIDESSIELGDVVRQELHNKPLHLVAHSMGGLVARNFIRMKPDLWGKIGQDGGGRLIMLGTPNYGSFAIPQVLTGVEKLVRLLAAADLSNNLAEVLDATNTFPGSYQMLPSPEKIPASTQMIYRRDTWGSFPISAIHLNRAFEFHSKLEIPTTIDPERMVYIAGCNQETLSGLRVISPGEFEYSVTYDGDGRVPHHLGLLKDVPTYYIEESHGSLPKNKKVLAAVEEILESGRTSELLTHPVERRGVVVLRKVWRSSASDRVTSVKLKRISERTKINKASADEIRLAEETILQAALGTDEKEAALPQLKKTPAVRKVIPIAFQVDIVLGDITSIHTPLAVVGHYKGVAPVNAEGAIDKKIQYWISRATEHGMIGAELGQLFFIPLQHGQIPAKAVLLAGMGESGRFRRADLRFLMTNITYAVSSLGLKEISGVLIGSGNGNLSREQALRGMLEGICEGLSRLPQKERLKKFRLVELDPGFHKDMKKILDQLKQAGAFPELELTVTSQILKRKTKKQVPSKRPLDLPKEALPGPKITIEREADVYRFSALGASSVIPVREVKIQSFFADGTSDRLITSNSPEEQQRYGRLLSTYLIPEDFQQFMNEGDSLTLVLDRTTAAFPWEMACYPSQRGFTFFGPDLKLTRQFRTMLSPAPGIAPPVNETLKVLVIADPASEPELQLPGAREEGRRVLSLLNEIGNSGVGKIVVVDRIGSADCDPVEILALLLNENFDIVHFAGHGSFNEDNPSKSGWVFGENRVLSASEIFRARRVPRLVFANACFSAVVKKGEGLLAEESNRRLAGLAEAFFERGVQNYVGTGWEVDDVQAVQFAEVFYRTLLDAQTLGEALANARKAIIDTGFGSTWGAYQHYGQVNTRLVTRKL